MAKPLLPDELWAIIEPLLPKWTPSPKGGHPRPGDRAALTGILFVLKTGIAWVKEHAGDYGVDAYRLGLTGASAGGHLASLVSVTADNKTAVKATGVFFPVYLNLMSGIADVDRRLVEVGRIYGFSSFALVRRILVPATLPSYITGLRGGLGLGWMFVVSAEMMGASAMSATRPSPCTSGSRSGTAAATPKASASKNVLASGPVATPPESTAIATNVRSLSQMSPIASA